MAIAGQDGLGQALGKSPWAAVVLSVWEWPALQQTGSLLSQVLVAAVVIVQASQPRPTYALLCAVCVCAVADRIVGRTGAVGHVRMY